MKTKQEIVENWLPRYTDRKLEDFSEYILLTNFTKYVELFADHFKVPILGLRNSMPNASGGGITINRRLYYIEYTSLTPFPGTVFYEQVKDEIIEHNPELYDMQHMLLESKLPLKKYYKEIMLTYLASYMPHRAVRARLNFKLSLNPMHPIYRSFIQFLFKVKRSYKDHEVIMPELKTESRKKSEERRKESWIKKQSEQIS